MMQLQFTLIILIVISREVQLNDIKSLECQFTNGFCKWNDPTGKNWQLGDYTKTKFGQPIKPLDNDGFIYSINTTNAYPLESPVLNDDTEPFCLYFNYFMFGLSTGSLTLQLAAITKDGSQFETLSESIWKREGSKYDDWILGRYHFAPSKKDGDMFKLQFIATSDGIALGSMTVKSGSCDYVNECDLEDPSLCFWTIEPDRYSNYRWFVSNGSSSVNDLVGFDATTQTEYGQFIRTPGSGLTVAESVFSSSIYFTHEEARCLSFQLYKSSNDSDALEVYYQTDSGSKYALWYATSSLIFNQQWFRVDIDINVPATFDYFKLLIQAYHSSTTSSPIALDDIVVSPDSCRATGSCNFDSGLCDYTLKSDQLLVGFGRLPDPTVINWDPIKNVDPYDLFVYTNTQKNEELMSYSLESPLIRTQSQTCLSFSYVFTYKQKGDFSIRTTQADSTESLIVWTLDSLSSEETWKSMRIALPDSFGFKLTFDFSGVQLFAAIDDIVVELCTDQQQKACEYNGLIDPNCINVVPSVFNNWLFMNTSILSNLPDLFTDHSENYKALVFDLTVPSRIESSSYFYISNLKSDTPYCLKFWYIIDGNVELNVWNDRISGSFDDYLYKSPLITLNSHFGLNWDQAKIQFNEVYEEMKIIFGAKYSLNSQRIVVINELELTEGSCSISYEYFCDFENECSWNNLDSNKSLKLTGVEYKPANKWMVVQAAGRYPGRDSTIGNINGHYMTTQKTTGDAIFMFPPFYLADNTTAMCFTFNVYPVSKNSFEIITEQNGFFSLVEKANVATATWAPFEVLLNFNPELSRVVRVYLVGSGQLGIDDLSIKMGGCSELFVCNDGKILQDSKVCDYNKDCSTGEDEQNCGDCSFNTDFCGYVYDEDGDWWIANGQLNVEKKTIWGGSTSIYSPPLKPTSPSCKLQFEYRKVNNAHLKVLLLFQDGHDIEVWDDTMLGSIENDTVQINLNRIPIPYNIHFYASFGITLWNAVDPISFKEIKLVDCAYGDTIDTQSSEAYTCKNGKRIRIDQLCDLSVDCLGGDDEVNCENSRFYSFEDKAAPNYWINLSNDRIKWEMSTATSSIYSAPTRDHSKGLGDSRYLAIYPVKDSLAGVSLNTEKGVALVGPELTSTDNCSMIFYYNTAGVTLSVSLINDSGNLIELIDLPTDSVFGFKRERINLKPGDVTGPFNFVFTAKYSLVHRQSYLGSYYAAVDDIVIDQQCFTATSNTPYENETLIPTANCPKNEFYCKQGVNYVCLSNDKLCDYHVDCEDKIDEFYCGSCQFDQTSLCGWTNEGEDFWVPVEYYTGKIARANIPKDNKPGNFIIPNKHYGDSLQSILKSPKLGATSSACYFNFSYFLHDSASLTIRLHGDQDSLKTFVDLPQSSDSWISSSLPMESLTPGYYIQFVLQVIKSDRDETVHGGLGSFQLTNCDPAWIESTTTPTPHITQTPLTTTQKTTEKTTTATTTTTTPKPTTKPSTKPTTQPTTRPTTRATSPPTQPVTTSPPLTTPSPPKGTTSPGKEDDTGYVTESNTYSLESGSVSFVALGSIMIIFAAIFAVLFVKKRAQSQNNNLPLIAKMYRGQILDQEDTVSLQNFESSTSINEIRSFNIK